MKSCSEMTLPVLTPCCFLFDIVVDSVILGSLFTGYSSLHVLNLNMRNVPVPIMNYLVLGLEEQQQWMIVVLHLAKM